MTASLTESLQSTRHSALRWWSTSVPSTPPSRHRG